MHDQLRARMKMRELTQDDVVPFNELLRYAFQVTNQELTEVGWDGDEDIRQSKSPILARAFVLGWFDGEKLASQIAVYPMIVNIYGKLLPMGGVTGVATYPEYSGIGLMHELMIRALGDMRRRGQTVSFLFPYDIPFYRHKGWEVVSDEMTFKLTDEQLPKAVDVPGMVEPCGLTCGTSRLLTHHPWRIGT
ncbi:MAG: GNAT family N-acetyltransferase [Clostridia bacterium]